jgi:hypothetical protein
MVEKQRILKHTLKKKYKILIVINLQWGVFMQKNWVQKVIMNLKNKMVLEEFSEKEN